MSARSLTILLASCWALTACDTESGTAVATCPLEAPAAAPETAAPGETVTLTTRPLTEAYDTVVTIGPVRAEVVSVDRATCDACDTCRVAAGCSDCGSCDACVTDCATCVETVSVLVPDIAEGPADVVVRNARGASAAGQLTVTAAPDDSGE